MYKLFSLLLVVLLVTVSAVFPPPPQAIPDDDTVAMVKASYIYQFANNNNWPNEMKKGKFYVGIIGNPGVYEIMSQKYGAKPIGSQTLDVLSLTELPANQYLHVVYIDKSKKSELAKCTRELKDKSTLIVTNWDGALTQGAHINFKNLDGTIRFELSKQAMEDKKITPGIKILQWAIQ